MISPNPARDPFTGRVCRKIGKSIPVVGHRCYLFDSSEIKTMIALQKLLPELIKAVRIE